MMLPFKETPHFAQAPSSDFASRPLRQLSALMVRSSVGLGERDGISISTARSASDDGRRSLDIHSPMSATTRSAGPRNVTDRRGSGASVVKNSGVSSN